MESASQFIIPDSFANFDWPRKLSEHFLEIKAESDAWARSFHPFDKKGMIGLKNVNCGLLGCLAYSTLDKRLTRLSCDLMVLFYVIDEYTDVGNNDDATKIYQIVMDALQNPHKKRPEGEHILGAMFKDFSSRLSVHPPPGDKCLERFIHAFDDYLVGVIEEARLRAQRRYSNFEDFLKLRKYTVGGIPTYVLCEFGLVLPEEVTAHPRMEAIHERATYVTAVTNDIYSYPMEKSRGGGLKFHNSVVLVMVEQNLDLQAPVNWLGGQVSGYIAALLDNIEKLPSWGDAVDQKVKLYVDAMMQAMRGTDDWCYEGRRYFGDTGLKVQKTRVMTMTQLLPEEWQSFLKN